MMKKGVKQKVVNISYLLDFSNDSNAQLTGKKLLAKIATKEQKPTVFCPCLIAC
jgi:hypothetical protein